MRDLGELIAVQEAAVIAAEDVVETPPLILLRRKLAIKPMTLHTHGINFSLDQLYIIPFKIGLYRGV